MAGIKDVAERAGLSIATVSRALSGKGNVSAASRERARSAAAELGFVPSYQASSLASGRTRNVGLVVPTVHRWYFSSVVEGVSAALLDAGYDLTLYNISEGADRRHSVLNDFLLRKRVDAVIAVALALTRGGDRPDAGHPPAASWASVDRCPERRPSASTTTAWQSPRRTT